MSKQRWDKIIAELDTTKLRVGGEVQPCLMASLRWVEDFPIAAFVETTSNVLARVAEETWIRDMAVRYRPFLYSPLYNGPIRQMPPDFGLRRVGVIFTYDASGRPVLFQQSSLVDGAGFDAVAAFVDHWLRRRIVTDGYMHLCGPQSPRWLQDDGRDAPWIAPPDEDNGLEDIFWFNERSEGDPEFGSSAIDEAFEAQVQRLQAKARQWQERN